MQYHPPNISTYQCARALAYNSVFRLQSVSGVASTRHAALAARLRSSRRNNCCSKFYVVVLKCCLWFVVVLCEIVSCEVRMQIFFINFSFFLEFFRDFLGSIFRSFVQKSNLIYSQKGNWCFTKFDLIKFADLLTNLVVVIFNLKLNLETLCVLEKSAQAIGFLQNLNSK